MHHPSRRAFLGGLTAAALPLPLASCATQSAPAGGDVSDYPSRSVTYTLPFDPGGESDVTARLQQQPLEDALGVSVVVTNRPGGGGAVGWSELVHQTRSDGYTFMGANLPHVILQPLARGQAGYETHQINWAYIFQSTPNALVVSGDSEFRTVDDFVAASQEEKLSLGGSGSYSANHVGALALAEESEGRLTYVPFSGTAAASPALLGGQVDGLMTYNTEALQLQDKGMRVLAIASEERVPEFPDVPTLRESGFDIVEGAWRGVAVPPDTPDRVISVLADAFAQVNQDREFVRKAENLGYHILDMGPEESKEFTRERTTQAEDLLRRFDLLHDQ
ncbi:Bug family tripartite tricarboxylate transporter substrate binding protein [Streptomonospora wellingtoniae]|uniref:Tripartite tricarboxylate transporter substrate binding protein n=1 Tax=Streptomonospora wellingtoniae TaxID=3075544 RepID=A0ABU2KXM9_9ACTN|nr:tripartite tricarboxylate transporter substrate binding protein [Streptomonospora sp. DSM 45055]MDT0304045.1 tripartite tricarboxylate transporter substrate binding protein [Streptomonospora sp. DSM 45055]